MSAFLFCTTLLCTADVLHDLCQASRTSLHARDPHYEPILPDCFVPARRDPGLTGDPMKGPVGDAFDVFDDLTESRLRGTYLAHYARLNGMLPSDTFVELDARGVRERTVVVHAWDDGVGEEDVSAWRKWRVRFDAAQETVDELFMGPMAMYEPIFVRAERRTDENGVFDALGAIDAYLSGADGHTEL